MASDPRDKTDKTDAADPRAPLAARRDIRGDDRVTTTTATTTAAERASAAAAAARGPVKKAPKVAEGDEVLVVTARAEWVPAEVIATHAGTDLIDVRFEYQGGPVTITRSPFDADGRKPDSWHRAQS